MVEPSCSAFPLPVAHYAAFNTPSSSSSTTSNHSINNNNPTASNNNNGGTQQRSTRGASKQRRDQINVEIQKLRDLLPLSDLIKDRLFQLQVMSLGCIFIRKHRYQQTVLQPLMSTPAMPRGIDICKALRGFMLMMTRSGKLLHVSDNACEYLGHSVEEIMCQGDSIYDLVDLRDHGAVQTELATGPPAAVCFPEERAFICRLNLARTAKRQLQYHKFILLKGRYIQPAEYYQAMSAQLPQSESDQPVFAAFCQPLINPENAESMAVGNTNVFSTQHFLDMKFKDADQTGCHHLGHKKEEIRGMSWYGMLHPNNVLEVSYKHRLLCQEKEGSVLSLVRVQSASGQWIWLHSVFSIRTNNETNSDGKRLKHVIHCFHQVLSELEAATLQANSWIYSMRHTYPTVVTSPESPQQAEKPPPSPPTPPYNARENDFVPVPDYDFNQIKVEIPIRPMVPHLSMFTPESSSPESSASLHSSLLQQPFPQQNVAEILDEILPATRSQDVLPELKDDVDEILRQVEQNEDVIPARTLAHRHSMFDPHTAELYKYLGPALFEASNDHEKMMRQPIIPPPTNMFPPNFQPTSFHYPFNMHPNYYQRKRSWAV
ncbi:unnamed protein product [Caenorhabditis bovis]|uniref:Uncharacterized protein n=1 Tax=Caenorhabditis bovis TaxID=2654633 RepID=A0A8S1EC53_9PELO|nr:unnamed protein product [Caenorhabditis bovis]